MDASLTAWIALVAGLIVQLLIDLFVLHRGTHVISMRDATWSTAGFIAISVAFGVCAGSAPVMAATGGLGVFIVAHADADITRGRRVPGQVAHRHHVTALGPCDRAAPRREPSTPRPPRSGRRRSGRFAEDERPTPDRGRPSRHERRRRARPDRRSERGDGDRADAAEQAAMARLGHLAGRPSGPTSGCGSYSGTSTSSARRPRAASAATSRWSHSTTQSASSGPGTS